jgi:hypothetical protein
MLSEEVLSFTCTSSHNNSVSFSNPLVFSFWPGTLEEDADQGLGIMAVVLKIGVGGTASSGCY